MKQTELAKRLIFESVFVGLLAGIVCIFYRFLLSKVEALYFLCASYVKTNPIIFLPWLIGLLALGVIISFFLRWEPNISGSGIPQVEAEVHGYIKQNPLRVLVSKICAGALSVLGGLSLGREGPSIQLGAMTGKFVSQVLKRDVTEEKYLLTCGASAGLSSAFNAPLAGVLFALEEVHKNFSRTLLVAVLCASAVADFMSQYVFGLQPTLAIHINDVLPFRYYGWILILGLCSGLFGAFYNWFMLQGITMYQKLKLKRYYHVFIPLAISSVLGLVFPVVMCGGHSAIEFLNESNPLLILLVVIFLVKFLFSVLSFGSGTAGGIFFPLLVLGALFGGIVGKLAIMMGVPATYFSNFVLLGTAAFFAAIVRAPITGVVLVAEMSGTLQILLPIVICSFVAYEIANRLGSTPIYDSLLRNLLKTKHFIEEERPTLHTDRFVVAVGCAAEGQSIISLSLSNALITQVIRHDHVLYPSKDLILHAGDHVIVSVKQSDQVRTREYLESLFHIS